MRRAVILFALAASACAPPGYMYDVGNFTHPHPTPALCASRGQVLDSTTLDCVALPSLPTPTPMQVAQQQQSDAITRQRNACVSAVTAKFRLQADGALASYAIWRAELKQCEDLMVSRLAAQQLKKIRLADCSLKLDWMLRYRMMVYDPDQKAMAEDRYEESCGAR